MYPYGHLSDLRWIQSTNEHDKDGFPRMRRADIRYAQLWYNHIGLPIQADLEAFTPPADGTGRCVPSRPKANYLDDCN